MSSRWCSEHSNLRRLIEPPIEPLSMGKSVELVGRFLQLQTLIYNMSITQSHMDAVYIAAL